MARRPSTDTTRERILSEALCRFALQGFAATSTREIAGALGLTKAALYYHFPTKDDILSALVSAATQQLRQILDGARGHTSVRARQRLLAAYVDYTAAHADLIRVFTLDPSARGRPAVDDTAPLNEALVRALAGVDAPDAEQRTRVRAALGGIHAAFRHQDPADDPEVVRHAALAAACGALGVAPPPAQRPSAPLRGSGGPSGDAVSSVLKGAVSGVICDAIPGTAEPRMPAGRRAVAAVDDRHRAEATAPPG